MNELSVVCFILDGHYNKDTIHKLPWAELKGQKQCLPPINIHNLNLLRACYSMLLLCCLRKSAHCSWTLRLLRSPTEYYSSAEIFFHNCRLWLEDTQKL